MGSRCMCTLPMNWIKNNKIKDQEGQDRIGRGGGSLMEKRSSAQMLK